MSGNLTQPDPPPRNLPFPPLLFLAGTTGLFILGFDLAYQQLSSQALPGTPPLRIVHSFNSCSQPTQLCDGALPIAGLFQQPLTGLLYGTTVRGGRGDRGIIFRVNVNRSASYQMLADFPCTPTQPQPTCRQGAEPQGRLLMLSDGYLYGTTFSGGVNSQPTRPGSGTIFRMLPGGQPIALYHFKGCNQVTAGNCDGENPAAGLLLGSDGNLYGTTLNGGKGAGTVFQLRNGGRGWIYRQIYAFQGGPTDGSKPYGELIEGTDGAFYGTTYRGGTNGLGTLFRLRPTGTVWNRQLLYSFSGGNTGSGPQVGLLQANGPWLYGTTLDDRGTIFRFSLATNTLTTLYQFRGTDGAQPRSPLLLGSDNFLYGTTYVRSNPIGENNGTIFKIHPDGGRLISLFIFKGSNGINPRGQLLQSRLDGNIYGITENRSWSPSCQTAGGCGQIFRLEVNLPIITNFMPRSGPPGANVMISGVNLASRLGQTQVSFAGVPAEVLFASNNQLRVRVPEQAGDGPITVTTVNTPNDTTTTTPLPFRVF